MGLNFGECVVHTARRLNARARPGLLIELTIIIIIYFLVFCRHVSHNRRGVFGLFLSLVQGVMRARDRTDQFP